MLAWWKTAAVCMSEGKAPEAENQAGILAVAGIDYQLDQAGYLLDLNCWSKAFAEAMAAREGLQLNPAYWQLIEFARDHYLRYDDSPPMRVLVKWVQQQLGDENGNSRYLYSLFPEGPGKQLSLLAGLPKPVSCI